MTKRQAWIDGMACNVGFELWGIVDASRLTDKQWRVAVQIAATRYALQEQERRILKAIRKRNRERYGHWLG